MTTRTGAFPHAKVERTVFRQLARSRNGTVQAVIVTRKHSQLRLVRKLGVRGTALKVLPMFLAPKLTGRQLAALRSSPFVRRIEANHRYPLTMEDTTWITKARYAWEGRIFNNFAATAQGATGKGVDLAVIDTGIDGKHEDTDNLVEFCETTGAVTGSANEAICSPDPATKPGPQTTACSGGPAGAFDDARLDSTDDPAGEGHGSHTSGTVAGSGEASGGAGATHSTIGIAREAKLHVYSANAGPALLGFEILASYDDLTCKKLNKIYDVVAVSNSWGGGGGSNYDESSAINQAIITAYGAGILSVFAAGNDGPEHDTLSAECINPYVVCVAATTKPDSIAGFSSVGRPGEPEDTNRNGRIGQPGAPPTLPDGPDANTDPDPNPAYDPGDVAPDNHDRLLGQKLDLGLYRPTVSAPGVNVDSINNEGDSDPGICPEGGPHTDCYVAFNGTSMATPHVTGIVGLIVQAYRKTHGNADPSPAAITDIIERSAQKLPDYESEEQGAGRIDAIRAVRLARDYPGGINTTAQVYALHKHPNLGTPTPPYQAGKSPSVSGAFNCPNTPPSATPNTPSTGGTNPAAFCQYGATVAIPPSWTVRNNPLDIENPVFPGQPYGQHFIVVPPKTERLRVTVNWGPYHPAGNLYIRLWRPGVNPDDETQPAGPKRVFPDGENVGLVFTGTSRFLDIRSPEAGTWVLRVYVRVPPPNPLPCATSGRDENPRVLSGVCAKYKVKIEEPQVQKVPTVAVTSPPPGTAVAGRFVAITGTATYPAWQGITNWEVPQTPEGGVVPPNPDTRTVLYLHGNAHQASGSPTEPGENGGVCGSDGKADQLFVDCGPFLIANNNLAPADLLHPTAGHWTALEAENIFSGEDRNVVDPNWVWCLSKTAPAPSDTQQSDACGSAANTTRPGPVTIGGVMTVEWWAQCDACIRSQDLSADWVIRLWADGGVPDPNSADPNNPDHLPNFERRVTATPDPTSNLPPSPGAPLNGALTRLQVHLEIPKISASKRIVLHIDPVFIDTQSQATIWYDRDGPCAGGLDPTPKCDSLVRMPVLPADAVVLDRPANLRVTDCVVPAAFCHNGHLRIAWDKVAGATTYRIYRSTSPAFTTGPGTLIATTAGGACNSPDVPSWPTASRPGTGFNLPPALCYEDTATAYNTTYYYRVVAVGPGEAPTTSAPSLLAYGTPTSWDRDLKVKVDRIYSPQSWEYKTMFLLGGGWWQYTWDTLELAQGPHNVYARSFNQGIGSDLVSNPLKLDVEGQPVPPRDPVVALLKTGPVKAARGATITYTLTYENGGPSASQNARVVDTLPAGVSFVSASNGGTYNPTTRKVTWSLGTLANGSSGSRSVTVKISPTTSVGTVLRNRGDFYGDLTLSPPTAIWATTVTS